MIPGVDLELYTFSGKQARFAKRQLNKCIACSISDHTRVIFTGNAMINDLLRFGSYKIDNLETAPDYNTPVIIGSLMFHFYCGKFGHFAGHIGASNRLDCIRIRLVTWSRLISLSCKSAFVQKGREL